MVNESVRTTLTLALNEYALQRGRIFGRIQNCRDALFDAENNLKRAQEADRSATFADDEQMRKMRELLDYYNSLPEPRPQALLEQHAAMGRTQIEMHRKRMAAHEPVRDAQSVVEERQRDLAVAEQDLKAIDARIKETTIEIERLNHQP